MECVLFYAKFAILLSRFEREKREGKSAKIMIFIEKTSYKAHETSEREKNHSNNNNNIITWPDAIFK